MAALPIEEIIPLVWAILGVLAALSVLAATLVLVKLVQFRRARLGDGRSAAQALQQWRAGERDTALSTAAAAAGPRAALLHEIFAVLAAHPGDTARAQARGTQRAIEDLAALDRNMRGIEAVVQSAPMLGLLGTVVGMIEAFGRLAQSTGVADPAELAGGIWTALITTALGLAIAIVFYFLSLWLEARITRERAALESLLAAVPGPDAAPGSG
mgnify:CR=1 FL=1